MGSQGPAHQEAFLDLRKQLTKGRVLLPGDEGFEASLERWSATCVLPAAGVAQPRTAEEASIIIKFAAANKVAFNVKGGGHSTSQVSASPSADGMVLDLSLMRDVSVNVEAQTVTFGGGCLWADVDDALGEHGLATPGGTVSHTGVGGLILHGGFGILTGLHGLTIDCLVSCQVVLADGSIVTASEKENTDLFWALRGAGSSFGVVTQFTSRAFPQGEVWNMTAMVMPNKLPLLVDFLNKWAETNDGTQLFALGFGYVPLMPGGDPEAPRPPIIVMRAMHVGKDPQKAAEEYFVPILDIETVFKDQRSMTYPEVNKCVDAFFGPGLRYLFGGANFTAPLSLSAAEAMGKSLWKFVDENPNKGLEASTVMLEGIPNGKSRSIPYSATAFASRGDYYNVGFFWTYTDASADDIVRNYNRQVQKDIVRLGYNDDEHTDGIGRYVNYLDRDQVTAETAFGTNAERLKKLKGRYDPENVFDKLWKLVGKIEDQWAA